jgi:predicted transcriptional regulator
METKLEIVRRRLEAVPYNALPKLAERAGVPPGTLARLKYGQAKNPRYETVEKLFAYWERLELEAIEAGLVTSED